MSYVNQKSTNSQKGWLTLSCTHMIEQGCCKNTRENCIAESTSNAFELQFCDIFCLPSHWPWRNPNKRKRQDDAVLLLAIYHSSELTGFVKLGRVNIGLQIKRFISEGFTWLQGVVQYVSLFGISFVAEVCQQNVLCVHGQLSRDCSAAFKLSRKNYTAIAC